MVSFGGERKGKKSKNGKKGREGNGWEDRVDQLDFWEEGGGGNPRAIGGKAGGGEEQVVIVIGVVGNRRWLFVFCLFVGVSGGLGKTRGREACVGEV